VSASAIKVLHVVVAGEGGGAERMLCELASRPEETEAEHVVALLTPNAALARMLEGAGLAVRDRGRVREDAAAFLWRSLGPVDVAWLARVARDEGATILHLHTFASHVLGSRAAQRVGLRVVRTEHSTRVYDDRSCWPFSRWSLRRADVAVAVSDHVARVAKAKAPWSAAKLVVVRNGVDVKRFAPSPSPREGAFTFVLVGRLEPRKGVDLAIEALAQLPDARLDVVGDGAERAALASLARRLGVQGRVVFHGHIDDPRALVSRAHAALCSSRTEGLGLANLEAMALGRAVVGFRVGGVPEIVEHGVTGLLAAPGDVDALAECMRSAMRDRDLLTGMGTAARAFVVEQCSIEAMCRSYRDVYRDVKNGDFPNLCLSFQTPPLAPACADTLALA
jgi:glycosyltransferase involved in cell wall biosynthesis